jgi:leader peptidase (prepilin peptidase)/N-methyltransferase
MALELDPAAAVAALFALLWGGLWGSFLNVVVYRVPAGLSVVHPRSRCPQCLQPITWWQNIPVLSWLLLRGRCACCKTPISLRYPLVEAVTALLTLAVAVPWLPLLLQAEELQWRPWLGLLGELSFVYIWLAIALIDADTFFIPDSLSLPLPLLGLALAALAGDLRGVTWQQSAAGALVAGGGLWLVQWGYGRLTGREGLGFGDVKLLAGMGALLGLQAVAALILAAALQGLLFALGYAAFSKGAAMTDRGLQSLRHLALPFGPFLVLGAVQWLLGHRLLAPLLQRWFEGGL